MQVQSEWVSGVSDVDGWHFALCKQGVEVYFPFLTVYQQLSKPDICFDTSSSEMFRAYQDFFFLIFPLGRALQ